MNTPSIGVAFSKVKFSGDFIVNNTTEDPSKNSKGNRFSISPRYYFYENIQGLYLAPYTSWSRNNFIHIEKKYTTDTFNYGTNVGYQLGLFKKGLILDLYVGLGRSKIRTDVRNGFNKSNSIFSSGIGIGYRF